MGQSDPLPRFLSQLGPFQNLAVVVNISGFNSASLNLTFDHSSGGQRCLMLQAGYLGLTQFQALFPVTQITARRMRSDL